MVSHCRRNKVGQITNQVTNIPSKMNDIIHPRSPRDDVTTFVDLIDADEKRS